MDMQKLIQEVKSHGEDLARYSGSISADALPEFESTAERIAGLAAELYRTPAKLNLKTRKRLEQLKAKIAGIRENIYDELEENLDGQSGKLAESESRYWASLLALPVLNADWIQKISRYGIYNGLTRKEIIAKLKQQDLDRTFEAVSGPFGRGEPLNAALENLQKADTRSRRFAVTETESIVFGLAGDAAMAFATANGCKLLYSAVMDNRVCEECAELDGRIFNAGDNDLPHVPQHAKCRCMLVPLRGTNDE